MRRSRLAIVLLAVATALPVALAAQEAPEPAPAPGVSAAVGPDVLVYQNGLAAVRERVPVNATGGVTRVDLDLPPQVLFETVRVAADGVTVREVRLPANATTAGPSPGDPVTVQTRRGVVTGTLVDAGDPVAVQTGQNETVFIPREQVITLTVPASVAAGRAEPRAVAVVEGAAGAGALTVTYLVQGPAWEPVYDLDPETGAFLFSGLVTDTPRFVNANLSLVAGQPHTALLPGEEERFRPFEEAQVAAAADVAEAPADQFVQRAEGQFAVFRLDRPVDLEVGEALRLPIEGGNLSVEDRRFDVEAFVGGFVPATGAAEQLPVQERVVVRNTQDFLLPSGVVNFVRDGLWRGSDELPFLAPNGTANLTVSTATRLDARLVTLSAQPSDGGTVVTSAVRVTNRGDDAAEVRVTVNHPIEDFRLIRTDPNATRVRGDQVVWDVRVQPGATEELRLTYELLQPPR